MDHEIIPPVDQLLSPMRISLSILLAVIIVACSTSCSETSVEPYELRIAQLTAERDSIARQAQQTSTEHQELMSYITGIESALDSISQGEQLLTARPSMGEKALTRTQIRDRIKLFGDLIKRQKDYIKTLEDSLRNNRSGASHLLTTITTLRQQLENKDRELAKLRAALNDQRFTVTQLQQTVTALNEDYNNLEEKNERLQTAMVTQNATINRGYILVADKKKLKELGILNGGGFLKKKTIDYSAFKEDAFEAVDMRTFKSYDIKSKKAKLLTPAPANSYKLEKVSKDNWQLTILSPADFWNISTFAVIQTD